MTREELLNRLVHIRELRLKAESAQLKERAQILSEIQWLLEKTNLTAAASSEDARVLADLGVLGEVRLFGARKARLLKREIVELSDRVTTASRMTEAAREARAALAHARSESVERAAESEAEHFFNWKRSAKQQKP